MKISTGSKELDEWLGGGYERDVITTLYGPAGSGKTNLCLIASVYQALLGKKVIYIDTEGGFSVERVKQIATSDRVLKNIFILRATNFSEQREAINKLLYLVNKQVGLVVVDSIAMLYRLELGMANQEKNFDRVQAINRALARQLRILAEIARKKYIPVLVTNQVYSEFLSREELESGKEKSVSMVGGDLLKYWSKCIIELQNLPGKKKAILRKHRSLPEKEFLFKITNKGIKKI